MSTDFASDSPSSYLKKKSLFDGMLTVYGRQAVKESLMHPDTKPYRLHLARSNKKSQITDDIQKLAQAQGAEICFHSRDQLARISKNGSQDQGVAIDLICKGFKTYQSFSSDHTAFELIALDGITNAQNLGMIIRSVCASPLSGLLLPRKGCARLDSLVIKASAGYLFKTPIYWCDELDECLSYFKEEKGCRVIGLASAASTSINEVVSSEPKVFVLGNESKGLSPHIATLCDRHVRIPMANQVESLNVAVAASLIAFRSVLGKTSE